MKDLDPKIVQNGPFLSLFCVLLKKEMENQKYKGIRDQKGFIFVLPSFFLYDVKEIQMFMACESLKDRPSLSL